MVDGGWWMEKTRLHHPPSTIHHPPKMICPNCGHDNLPGSEECSSCLQDLTQLDRPTAQNRVERSLMEDPVSVLNPQKPVTVRPTTTIREAVQIMLTWDIGALLSVDGDIKL